MMNSILEKWTLLVHLMKPEVKMKSPLLNLKLKVVTIVPVTVAVKC